MWITCMKKKAKFMSNSIQNVMVTCMQKRVKIKSSSIQKDRAVTCKQKWLKIKSLQNAMVVT